MCDTQVILTQQGTYFAKNSDREPTEAQHVVRLPPVESDKAKSVKATYISITQSAKRYGVILSQPSWIWGGEMGVNDQGVAIGNEAVFTKLVNKTGQALLGMDFVRVALERSSCADEALNIITRLLDSYGQGGPAGYRNKQFRYDNSFIIADNKKAWQLETAGKWWAARQVRDYAAISNTLSIGEEYDLAKAGLEDFARKEGYTKRFDTFNFAKAFDTYWMPKLGAAKTRQQTSLACLKHSNSQQDTSLVRMIENLRHHHEDKGDFRDHSNRDICMHAGSLIRPSQTCSSLVAHLSNSDQPEVMMTGTSAPCMSLFKPIDFEYDHPLLLDYRPQKGPSLWQRFEVIHRRALHDKHFRRQLIESRNIVEKNMLALTVGGKIPVPQADRLAAQWHQEWEKKAENKPVKYSAFKMYDRFWRKAVNSEI